MNEKFYEIKERIIEDIKSGKWFYESIFTDELNGLDEEDQDLIIASIQADFGLGYKELGEL